MQTKTVLPANPTLIPNNPLNVTGRVWFVTKDSHGAKRQMTKIVE